VSAPDPDEHARQLAAQSLAGDDVTGWFEQLYRQADRGEAVVPWDRGGPHPLLVRWAQDSTATAGRALVVGAGPGSDAELVAGLGLATVAFDVSPTAIRAARARFPGSAVQYVVADLLDPPAEWLGRFDLVIESMTVQSMPRRARAAATANVASFVAPGGTLVVIAFAADGAVAGDAGDGPPWPLTKDDIDAFATGGIRPVSIELVPNLTDPAAARWLAEFRRAAETEPDRDSDIELVLAAYAAFARGDIDAAVRNLHPDVEWIEPDEFPGGGRYVGPAAVAGYLGAARAQWAELHSQPTARRDGDRIVVVHRVNGRLLDGTEVDNAVADVFTVEAGLVTHMQAFADPDAV
jgi:ketosteroid isomerase-like protein